MRLIKHTKSGPLGKIQREVDETRDLPNIDLYGDLTFFSSLPPESQQADASARSALGSFKMKQKESRLISAPVAHISSAKAPKPQTGAVEVKPVEVKPVEVNPVEVKPVEVKPVEVKPVEVKPTEVKPVPPRPSQIVSTALPRVEQAARFTPSKPAEPAPKPKAHAVVTAAQATQSINGGGGSLVCAECGSISEDHDLICIECGSFLG